MMRTKTYLRRSVTAAVLCAVIGGCSGCRAAQPWPLWEQYQAKFMDAQGRVIDHKNGDRTTTEGEAYAMFFALVDDDRPRFDKLLSWTEQNLAAGDLTLHLPAWSWGHDKDGWHVLDAHPAADADLWMAYTLCEAGRLWHDDRYAKLGEVMAARIAQQEVVLTTSAGTTLIPGAQGFHPDATTWYVNPSYMPPELLAYFAKRDAQAPWGQVMDGLTDLVGSQGGFVMDWMVTDRNGVHPTAWPPLLDNGQKNPAAAIGSYDAIRMYLWVGMADPHTRGVKELLAQMHGMELYLHSHVTPPLKVDSTGKVLDPDAPAGFSAAVIPYLHSLGLKADEKAQNDRLAATKDAGSGLYGTGGDYYDQNLALFATGWNEQRFRFESDGRLKPRWK
jgi:endoglucanase